MVWRIIRFLAGAGIAGGGGYLVWTHRGEAQALYPFVLDAAPWYLIAGLALLVVGMVTVVSSLLPGVSAQKKAEKAARRDAHLREADSFYAERARAVERDWRSSDLPPEPAPAQPDALPPAAEPVAARPAPVAELSPAAASAQAPRPEKAAPLPPPAPPPAGAPAPSIPAAPSSAPVQPFPSLATLAPIPATRSIPEALPPHLTRPASARGAESPPPPAPTAPPAAPEPAPGPAPVPEAARVPEQPAPQPAAPQDPLEAIRVAIAASRLDEADRLLASERTRLSSDGSDPLALAELTGLAGDHAAAAGRLGGAKWLWRLSLQRFAAANAIASPAARAVSERLRLADR